MQKLRNHVLVQTFRELKGNPKWSICTEPLWFIPYSLFVPFQTLYMRKLGLSSVEIGTTVTVGFILQMFFALIGGVITDKMGRRKATVIFDTLGWTVPCLIWAFSQNFWWFLAAAAVNAAFQITNTSWNCLFIEDCPPKHITNAFTLIQMCGMLSVFFSPLAVFLVGKYDVVPVMRWLYFIAAISMLAKFLLLYYFGGETKVGKKRMEETKNLSYFSMMKGYGAVFLTMIKSGKMRLVVYFMALTNIIQISTTNFFSLYVTEELHLSDELVAVFPVIRTLVMLAFVIGLQNLFQKLRMKVSFLVGFFMYIASHLLLLLTPEKNLLLVMGYTILEAAAYAVIIPRKDALMAHYVEQKERSRIYALYNVLMIGISVPFGSLIGWMFEVNPGLPFLFNIALFGLCILLTMGSRDLSRLEESIG
ncbi:MAG: MFS transporter [Blautia sp.]|uniref:MFS transporter n=1 Tax=Blautia sp. TaxID=1955243 RepID=UPI002E75E5B9|nr:MFS transporter [Blautia sp.]MEE1442905.1 MFS transporter [Blautia sp.]